MSRAAGRSAPAPRDAPGSIAPATPLRDAWSGVPALLFGDLDPNGVAIARALQDAWPGVGWYIPEFAEEYLERALPAEWPEIEGELPGIVRVLIERGVWLEQEVFVLDGRLVGGLDRAVGRG